MPAALSRSVLLPRPQHGEAERVQMGRAEIVLENRRGSYSLLWSNGRESMRYVLGLTDRGHLSIELCAPRYPLACMPREAMTLVPGARLRGYVTVPLVPTVIWRTRPDSPERVLELMPQELEGVWTEAAGHAFRVPVTWMTRFPFASAEPHCVVPVRLQNASDAMLSPSQLDIRVQDSDLVEMRGAMVVRPRRITLHASTDDGEAEA